MEAYYCGSDKQFTSKTIGASADLSADMLWVDLTSPSEQELQWADEAYNISLPTLKSLKDISASARAYRDPEGRLHISAYMLIKNRNISTEELEQQQGGVLASNHTVAFILDQKRVYTLRDSKMLAFQVFKTRAFRKDYDLNYTDPTLILLGLLESELDELADILEDVHKDLERCTAEVLNNHYRESVLDLDDMVTRLALQEDVLAKAQLCLIDLRRILSFLLRPRALENYHLYDADMREIAEDVRSLIEHNAFLFQKVRFLLDTTSGFITTEQSDIIRRFSVISSMLAPPMLVTGFYGMNINYLPAAHSGSSLLILGSLVLVAFLIPLGFFKYKGWL